MEEPEPGVFMVAVLIVLFMLWAAIVVAVVALCLAARRTDAEIALDDAIARPGPRKRSEHRTPSGTSN